MKTMQRRVLSGIQPSGRIHLGNYLGAIKQHIAMQENYECFFFIADLHALTTTRDPKKLQEFTREVALTYIALGLDPDRAVLFRQSDIEAHTELAWILSTIAPMGLLERAHAWKDAMEKGKKEKTAGLFTYPILMAADILLYQPDLVPVGKDQKQHIEIARDLATAFNGHFGETLKLPEPLIEKDTAVVPGTDGQKMSKSYGNTIDIFADDKTLTKQVMSIVTDSTPVEAPKNPDTCTIFALYKLLASSQETKDLASRYKKGGMGYGEAKKLLLAKITDVFGPARKKRIELERDLGYIERVLQSGARRAQEVANATRDLVRKKVGTR